MPLRRRDLLLLPLATWGGAAIAQKPRIIRMQLTLNLDQSHFWTGEEPNIDVTIRNNGPVPVEVPSIATQINRQPAYTLRGPSYPTGRTRGMREALPDMPLET